MAATEDGSWLGPREISRGASSSGSSFPCPRSDHFDSADEEDGENSGELGEYAVAEFSALPSCLRTIQQYRMSWASDAVSDAGELTGSWLNDLQRAPGKEASLGSSRLNPGKDNVGAARELESRDIPQPGPGVPPKPGASRLQEREASIEAQWSALKTASSREGVSQTSGGLNAAPCSATGICTKTSGSDPMASPRRTRPLPRLAPLECIAPRVSVSPLSPSASERTKTPASEGTGILPGTSLSSSSNSSGSSVPNPPPSPGKLKWLAKLVPGKAGRDLRNEGEAFPPGQRLRKASSGEGPLKSVAHSSSSLEGSGRKQAHVLSKEWTASCSTPNTQATSPGTPALHHTPADLDGVLAEVRSRRVGKWTKQALSTKLGPFSALQEEEAENQTATSPDESGIKKASPEASPTPKRRKDRRKSLSDDFGMMKEFLASLPMGAEGAPPQEPVPGDTLAPRRTGAWDDSSIAECYVRVRGGRAETQVMCEHLWARDLYKHVGRVGLGKVDLGKADLGKAAPGEGHEAATSGEDLGLDRVEPAVDGEDIYVQIHKEKFGRQVSHRRLQSREAFPNLEGPELGRANLRVSRGPASGRYFPLPELSGSRAPSSGVKAEGAGKENADLKSRGGGGSQSSPLESGAAHTSPEYRARQMAQSKGAKGPMMQRSVTFADLFSAASVKCSSAKPQSTSSPAKTDAAIRGDSLTVAKQSHWPLANHASLTRSTSIHNLIARASAQAGHQSRETRGFQGVIDEPHGSSGSSASSSSCPDHGSHKLQGCTALQGHWPLSPSERSCGSGCSETPRDFRRTVPIGASGGTAATSPVSCTNPNIPRASMAGPRPSVPDQLSGKFFFGPFGREGPADQCHTLMTGHGSMLPTPGDIIAVEDAEDWTKKPSRVVLLGPGLVASLDGEEDTELKATAPETLVKHSCSGVYGALRSPGPTVISRSWTSRMRSGSDYVEKALGDCSQMMDAYLLGEQMKDAKAATACDWGGGSGFGQRHQQGESASGKHDEGVAELQGVALSPSSKHPEIPGGLPPSGAPGCPSKPPLPGLRAPAKGLLKKVSSCPVERRAAGGGVVKPNITCAEQGWGQPCMGFPPSSGPVTGEVTIIEVED